MSRSPVEYDRNRELEVDGGDSSRESGIGDPRNEVEEVPEREDINKMAEEGREFEDEGCGCGPNPSCGSDSNNSTDDIKEEGAFSLTFGVKDELDESGKDKEDVKKITGFDKACSQQRRRKEALEWQRQRRDEILDKIRQLEDSAFSDSETEDEMDFTEAVRRATGHQTDLQTLEEIFEEGASSEQMEVLVPNKNKSKRTKRKNRQSKIRSPNEGKMDTTVSPSNSSYYPHYSRRPKFRQAPCRPMLSEWLLEKPEDFEEMWLGVICPAGKRVIVMASRGKTKIYSRSDEYLGSYKSLLPGGCRYNYRDPTTNRNRGVTILDCIWSEQTQTFYVLDMICWNSHSCVNCDTDYRQFFLTSKFSENMELLERSATNPFPFKPLPYFPASELPLVLWSTIAFPEEIDGIVFFHKEAFYISETNPLTLWILLTQIESILNVSVSPELLSRQKKVKNLSSRKRQQKMMNQKKESKDMEVGLG